MINLTEKHTFRLERCGEVIEFASEEAVTLCEVLELFERYLRACGFVFDGVVDITPEEV